MVLVQRPQKVILFPALETAPMHCDFSIGYIMKYALEVHELHKIYNNGFSALKGISFTVEEGDFFALLGPNGAGKSTTLGIVSSLINKSQGQVKVLGYDLDKNLDAAKCLMGIVPQEFNFNMFEKVVDIIVQQAGYYGISRPVAKLRANELLKQLGLWEQRNNQSHTLSGGMKRRLMIARALVHKPKLLILDEPTAGVDIELRRSMWDFLMDINQQGTTIILTTHYLEEAENLCRNIAIIDQGQIVQNTSIATLLRQTSSHAFYLDLATNYTDLSALEGFSATFRSPTQIQVVISGEQTLNDVYQALIQADIQVVSMRNKTNRLEELFVDLVQKNKANIGLKGL